MWLSRLFTLLALLFCVSCGSSGRVIRIAVDPTWYPINFGAQQPYVNGFIDELLLEVAGYNGVVFERIAASGSSLYDGLKTKKYDAVLSSLEPYVFNTAQYDFSRNILNLGPVLITPKNSSAELDKMDGSLVGLIAGDPARLELEKNATLVLRTYESPPALLDAVVAGEVNAAVLDYVLAARYVADIYEGVLKVASPPMTAAGLRVVTLKGSSLTSFFNKTLKTMQKKKKLDALLKKWNLNSTL